MNLGMILGVILLLVVVEPLCLIILNNFLKMFAFQLLINIFVSYLMFFN